MTSFVCGVVVGGFFAVAGFFTEADPGATWLVAGLAFYVTHVDVSRTLREKGEE